MTMKFNHGLWVLLWMLLIHQSFASKFNKPKPDSMLTKLTKKVLGKDQVTEPIYIDGEVKIPQDPIEEPKPIENTKLFICAAQTKLSYSQKYIVYNGVYPVVMKYCSSHSLGYLTRLIVQFVWPTQLPPAREFITTPRTRATVDMVHLSSDTTWLVSRTGSNVSLWYVPSNKFEWTITTHTNYVTKSIVSSDDQYIITASSDKTLKSWALLTGEPLRTFTGHTHMVDSCCLSTDNQFLLSWSLDKTLRRWSMQTGTCTHVVMAEGTIRWAHFYAAGNRIVAAIRRDVRIWDVPHRQCVRVLRGHTDWVMICAVSGSERLLLSTSADHTARAWDVATGVCLSTFRGHKYPVASGFVVRDDTCAVSVDFHGTLFIWRVSDGYPIHLLTDCHPRGLQLNSYWLTCGKDRRIECIIISNHGHPYKLLVLDVELGNILFTLSGHKETIEAISVSSDGKYLISGSSEREGMIKMFVFAEHKEY